MTATLAASAAILKIRYPEGKLPVAAYKQFKYVSTCPKREDFTGESRKVSVQNEYPQGSGTTVADAQDALQQGTYNAFTITRVEHFGVARIKGQALKAAEGDPGALTDLWKNETNGTSKVETMMLEIHSFGNGSGVLGRISAASNVGSTTITLETPSDIVKFALGMKVQAVSDATLSPTLRSGGAKAKITGIDRNTGTLTISGNWNASIAQVVANDYLVRASEYAIAGTASVIMGLGGFIVGGSAPGTLFSLNRNTDPVRLSGQAISYANVPLEEAVQDASAQSAVQAGSGATRLWCHNLDLAAFKKAIGTKVTYPKTDVKSTMAGVGFKGIEIEGDDEVITIMTSPFCPRNTAFLIDPESTKLDSLGPAPHLQNYDKADMLRVSGDDAYEARFGFYGQHYVQNLVSAVKMTSFGA